MSAVRCLEQAVGDATRGLVGRADARCHADAVVRGPTQGQRGLLAHAPVDPFQLGAVAHGVLRKGPTPSRHASVHRRTRDAQDVVEVDPGQLHEFLVRALEDLGLAVPSDRDTHEAQPCALGGIAVVTKHELVLAIIGGLFVLETVSVIVQVASFKMTGRRVFKMAPLHHHFEQKGWAEPTIVIRFWIIAMVLALVGLATLKLR